MISKLCVATSVFNTPTPLHFSQACQSQHSHRAALPSSTAPPGATAARVPRGSILSRSAQRRAAEGEGRDGGDANLREAQAEEVKIEHAYNSVAGSASAEPSAHLGTMEALSLYCEAQSEPEPPLLSSLREETLAHYAGSPGATRMLCDPLQGRLLALVATITKAKLVLELGAFTGYSAICLATGLAGDDTRGERQVISCEPDAVAREIALKYITQGGLLGTIDLRDAKAMAVIEALRADPAEPLLDLVFLDADKKQYKQYVLALMGGAAGGGRPLLRDGALILVDNTLWKGLVLDVNKVYVVHKSCVVAFHLTFLLSLQPTHMIRVTRLRRTKAEAQTSH